MKYRAFVVVWGGVFLVLSSALAQPSQAPAGQPPPPPSSSVSWPSTPPAGQASPPPAWSYPPYPSPPGSPAAGASGAPSSPAPKPLSPEHRAALERRREDAEFLRTLGFVGIGVGAVATIGGIYTLRSAKQQTDSPGYARQEIPVGRVVGGVFLTLTGLSLLPYGIAAVYEANKQTRAVDQALMAGFSLVPGGGAVAFSGAF